MHQPGVVSMSRWIKFAAATVLSVAVVACGANGGDPVARQQIPPGQTDSPQQPADSGLKLRPGWLGWRLRFRQA
jgi:hypothetical protein